MAGHLLRREGLRHQRRVRDDGLYAGLLHKAADEVIDRILVRSVVHQDEGVRRGENLLNTRVSFCGEEDSGPAREIPRGDKKDNCSDRHRDLMRSDQTRQAVGGRYVGFLRRVVDGSAEEHHQGGHDGKGADERTNDTFGKHHAHVGTNLQAHKTEHQQSHDSSERRREDRGSRLSYGSVRRQDRCTPVSVLVLLLPVPVKKDDAIVEREHRLQNSADEISGYRDGGQQSVGAHIEDNRQASRDENDDGFEPRLCHDEEHRHNDYGGENHDRDGRSGTVLAGLNDAVASEAVADLLAECFLVHRLGDIKIEECVGAVGAVTTSGVVHIGVRLQERTDAGHLLRANPLKHHVHISAGHLRGAELGVDDFQSAFHLRVIGQVLGQVSIDVHTGHQNAADNRQRHRNRKQYIMEGTRIQS